MEEFNLNNPNNLNPDINQPMYQPLKKEGIIKEFNNRPKVKNRKIKAIDTEKSSEISNKSLGFLKLFSILGILAIIILAGGVGTYVYILYNDGTTLNPIEMVCSDVNLNTTCGDNNCPDIPKCPDCNLECSDVECNFPSTLDINLNDTG